MAVLGRLLVSSAERLDLPDLLSLDSYAAGDWKFFLQGIVGSSKPYILKGFDVIDPQNAIGTQSCSVRVADSITFYPGSNSGSFYHGLPEGNSNSTPLVPELRKNAVNYVYLTFSTFNTSVDTRAFWDPDKDGGAGGEFTQDVNTESVLKVDINVSTGSFPANTVPVAKVTVGPVVITKIEDARDLMFRLGSGGISPNPYSQFSFRSLPSASYQRAEPPTAMTNPSDPNPFQGADKNIYSLKEWMDVVMTKLLELGGTTFWYENAAATSIVSIFNDVLATTFKSKGQWQHSSSTPGLLTWTEDVQIKETNGTEDVLIRAGNKTLLDEQVAYLPLTRDQPLNAFDQPVAWTNSQNYVNTIGGAIGLFANLSKGDWIKKNGDGNHLFVRVEEFYDAVNLGGSVTTAANARSVRLNTTYQGTTADDKGRYDKGVYQASDVTVANRNSSALTSLGGNFHWLAIRSDTIENVATIQSFTVTGTLSEPDGQTAKVTATAHGLQDGDMITVTAPVAHAGTYAVEVEDVNTFYIQTTALTTGAFTSFYGLSTTAARDNGYGLQLESANHGFNSGDTVIVAGTTNFNNAYIINKRSATQFQFAAPAVFALESTGTATLARVIVRYQTGSTTIIQGEVIDISGPDAQNIRNFIGMTSQSQQHPLYVVPISYNTLDGMANYNAATTDNVTARLSKLTAMMADKAQDKTIQFNADYTKVTNTTNGADQDITFLGGDLLITLPGSAGQGTLPLSGTVSLGMDEVAYLEVDRNDPFTFTGLGDLTVAAVEEVPVDENVLVFAYRVGSTGAVWLWDGIQVPADTTVSSPVAIMDQINQDRNIKLLGGGTWSWNGGLEQLTWSADAYMQFAGFQDDRNQISSATITLNANEVAYIELNRTTDSPSVRPVTVANIDSITPTDNLVIFARRDGSDVVVGHSFRLVDGESKKLDAGISDQNLTLFSPFISIDEAFDANDIDWVATHGASGRFFETAAGFGLFDAISEFEFNLDSYNSQLRAVKTATSIVTLKSADQSITADTSQLISLTLNGFKLQFSSGTINFQTGAVTSGTSFTPFSIPVGEQAIYGISVVPGTVDGGNGALNGSILVTQPPNSDISSPDYPVLPQTGHAVGFVLVHNVAGTITILQVIEIPAGGGSAGTGTGDANSITETLKNRLLDSPYQLVTPNIASQNEDDLLDMTSQAAFSPANRTFEFSAAEDLITVQMLDANEFLNNFDALEEIELLAFWRLAFIDTTATYYVSRNGGSEYQTVTMSRIGNTDLYRGYHKFTDESVNQVLSSYAVLNGTTALNATTQQKLAQPVVLANKSLAKTVTLELNKLGTPTGTFYVSVVKDNAGSPSTDPGDILCESAALSISALSSGNNSLVVNIPDVYLIAGTYHLVVRTDAAYKVSFSAGVDQLSWRVDTAAGTPYLLSHNGTAWSNVTNTKAGYSLAGIVLDLRIKITSSAGNKQLEGLGILYDKLPGTMLAGIKKREVFSFQAVADNENEFTLTRFVPDPELLTCYYIQSGQVFKYPAFQLNGQQIIFPANSFNNSGIEADVTLVFDQSQGSSFDNSDLNALIIAGNFLGSTDPNLDRSAAGRGIFLRRPDGTLREITIDDSDNIAVFSV